MTRAVMLMASIALLIASSVAAVTVMAATSPLPAVNASSDKYECPDGDIWFDHNCVDKSRLLTELNSNETNCDINPDNRFCNGYHGRDGLPFCDLVRNAMSCYDRNDNPESYCANFGENDRDFCKLIGEICDDEGSSNSLKSTDPECTKEGLPCPEDYIRYGKYCVNYRTDCDLNPASVYCNGEIRNDGLLICDNPSHPTYKFCKTN
jgi:hypothetical protein